MNHCGSFPPDPFCDSITVNIRFAFPAASFWFNFLPWRQGSVHLLCQLERRNLSVVNIPGHSQKSSWVLSPRRRRRPWVVILVMLYYCSPKQEHKVEIELRMVSNSVCSFYLCSALFSSNKWLILYPYSIAATPFKEMKDERGGWPIERVIYAFSWALGNVVFLNFKDKS